MKKLYKPKMTLKEVVMELAEILCSNIPYVKPQITELLEEMEKWGIPQTTLDKEEKERIENLEKLSKIIGARSVLTKKD